MRRLKGFVLLAIAALLLSGCAGKQSFPYADLNRTLTNEMSDTSSLHRMDKDIEYFMRRWELKGVSLAVMRRDSLLYAKGYGWADEEKEEKMGPGNIMRLASVSKLITAVGIMTLREQGKLSLEDKVFGPEGILCDSVYTKAIRDRNYFKITVEDLLRHEGGFSVRAGDPMFSTLDIMRRYDLDTPPDSRTLVSRLLGRKLRYAPGTTQEYSNLGYLLLSMIIEKVSGEDYEDWMQKNVLRKAGCRDFHIAQNTYAKKYRGEVRYYVPSNEPLVPEYTGSGKEVVRCYGGNNITALSGAGAWVASVPELMLLVASIDGRPEIPDILSRESVDEMTRYYDDATYALGWNDTKPGVGWTRTGTFSGTSALIKYFPDGECWIIVTNTSTWKGPRFARYTKALFSTLRSRYSDLLPARDFFRE